MSHTLTPPKPAARGARSGGRLSHLAQVPDLVHRNIKGPFKSRHHGLERDTVVQAKAVAHMFGTFRNLEKAHLAGSQGDATRRAHHLVNVMSGQPALQLVQPQGDILKEPADQILCLVQRQAVIDPLYRRGIEMQSGRAIQQRNPGRLRSGLLGRGKIGHIRHEKLY